MTPVANLLKLTGTVRGRGKKAQRVEKKLPAQRFFFARLGKLLASKKPRPCPIAFAAALYRSDKAPTAALSVVWLPFTKLTWMVKFFGG